MRTVTVSPSGSHMISGKLVCLPVDESELVYRGDGPQITVQWSGDRGPVYITRGEFFGEWWEARASGVISDDDVTELLRAEHSIAKALL